MIPGRSAPLRLPQGAVVPDYGAHGLFGLVGTIRRFVEGAPWSLPGEAPSAGGANLVVFLLIDGLGDGFLQRFGAGGALHAHRRRRITSVFPSTTASAVTTVLSGLAPAAHGLTGWFVRDRRFGDVVAPLPTRTRRGQPLRAALVPQRLFPYPALFARGARRSIYVNPKSLAYSTYSTRHGRGATLMPYRRLEGFVEAVVEAVSSLRATGGGYVHAYYPLFDALSHTFGCASEQVVAEFRRIDAAFAALLERLAGTGADLVASADHGFIDSPPRRLIRLDRRRALASMLAAPLFGERRAAFCEVRRGAEGEFEAYAREVLGGKGTVVRSASLARAGFFGPRPAHRRLHERIGTHALLMEAGWTVCDRVPGEHAHRMIGVHGGLSPDEMWIPLIHARC